MKVGLELERLKHRVLSLIQMFDSNSKHIWVIRSGLHGWSVFVLTELLSLLLSYLKGKTLLISGFQPVLALTGCSLATQKVGQVISMDWSGWRGYLSLIQG